MAEIETSIIQLTNLSISEKLKNTFEIASIGNKYFTNFYAGSRINKFKDLDDIFRKIYSVNFYYSDDKNISIVGDNIDELKDILLFFGQLKLKLRINKKKIYKCSIYYDDSNIINNICKTIREDLLCPSLVVKIRENFIYIYGNYNQIICFIDEFNNILELHYDIKKNIDPIIEKISNYIEKNNKRKKIY